MTHSPDNADGFAGAPSSLPDDRPPLRLGRYLIAALALAAWIMLGALHIPVDLLFPDIEFLFFPSYVFFLPLSVFYGRLLPWRTDTVPAHVAMLAFDLVLTSLLCLPFLYPRGRRQNILSLLTLLLIATYTMLALSQYLLKTY